MLTSQEKKYDIYGIGAALVDTEITLSDADLTRLSIAKSVMSLVDEERQTYLIAQLHEHLTRSKRASGGSAANTIIAASYFGCQNFFSCKVANDENGHFYLGDLAAAKVNTASDQTKENGITGKCLVLITPDAERTMNTYLGISAHLSEAELDLAAAQAAQFVYIEGYLVTSPSGKQAAITLKQHAEQYGAKIAISLSDPAMAQFFRDGLLDIIGNGVDLLFCNQDEALAFTQTQDLDTACLALRAYAKRFAITCGAQGALIFDGQSFITVAAPKVQAIDSNGAGDMFAGAFLYSLCQGESETRAGEFACAAAAQVVSQFGPRLRAEQHQALKTQFWA